MARLRIALLALAVLVLAPSVALAEGTGVITGRLENRTPGGTPPAGATVTLRVFEGLQFDRQETVVSSTDGNFVFSGLDTGATAAYRVLAEHQGGLFAGDPISFANSESVEIVIFVYDTVTTDPGLRTTQHSLILTSGGDRSLGALHVVTLELPGDHALVVGGDAGPGIEFVTAPEVIDFRALEGFEVADLDGTPTGFLAMMTLKPGENRFTFSYIFAWEPGGTQLTVGSRPAIGELLILTPAGDLVVEGTAVRPGEEMGFQGMTLESWRVEASALGPANQVWLREPKSIGALAAVGRVPAGVWGGLGAVVFAIILAVSALRAPSFGRDHHLDARDALNSLLQQIAALDREIDASSPSEDALRRRAAAKHELLELLRGDPRLQSYLGK